MARVTAKSKVAGFCAAQWPGFTPPLTHHTDSKSGAKVLQFGQFLHRGLRQALPKNLTRHVLTGSRSGALLKKQAVLGL